MKRVLTGLLCCSGLFCTDVRMTKVILLGRTHNYYIGAAGVFIHVLLQ